MNKYLLIFLLAVILTLGVLLAIKPHQVTNEVTKMVNDKHKEDSLSHEISKNNDSIADLKLAVSNLQAQSSLLFSQYKAKKNELIYLQSQFNGKIDSTINSYDCNQLHSALSAIAADSTY